MQPEIVVLLLCKGRIEYTLRVIHSLEANLAYDNYSYFIADGGSTNQEYERATGLLDDYGVDWTGHHHDLPAGKNWNTAIKEVFQFGVPIYLRMENDFVLKERLDPTPYVELLTNLENVGCIRLGLLPIKLDIHTMGYDGRIYQHIKKSTQYAWSGNPCLVHRRFHTFYGYFSERLTPQDEELYMDNQFRRKDGPYIWRPNELGDYGPFDHIGEIQSEF